MHAIAQSAKRNLQYICGSICGSTGETKSVGRRNDPKGLVDTDKDCLFKSFFIFCLRRVARESSPFFFAFCRVILYPAI